MFLEAGKQSYTQLGKKWQVEKDLYKYWRTEKEMGHTSKARFNTNGKTMLTCNHYQKALFYIREVMSYIWINLYIEQQWMVASSQLGGSNTDTTTNVGFVQNLLGQRWESIDFSLSSEHCLKVPLSWTYKLNMFYLNADKMI